MTDLLTFRQASAAPVTLRCPPGHELRVVAVLSTNFSATVAGDQSSVAYMRGGEVIIRAMTNAALASTVDVCFGLGLAMVEPQLASVDPVTGLAVLFGMDTQAAPLPDVWFPFDVTVELATTHTVTDMTVTYEVRRL